MRIHDFDNPEAFQRFVKALLTAEFGDDFQAIDDSGGDGGNDGYIKSKRTMVAIFCPEKKADSKRYIDKINGDFTKTLKLRSNKGYAIEKWYFITPSDLREEVQTHVRGLANANDVFGSCLGETYLQDLFLRHPHLQNAFPDVASANIMGRLSELKSGLDEVKDLLKRLGTPEAGPAGRQVAPFTLDLSKDLAEAQAEMLEGKREKSIATLERLRRTSSDQRERAWAIALLVQCKSHSANVDEIEEIAREGISAAERVNETAPLAICKAELGVALSRRYATLAMHLFTAVQMARSIGIMMSTVEELDQLREQVLRLLNEAQTSFKEAYELTRGKAMWREGVVVLFHFATGLMTMYVADQLSGQDQQEARVRLRTVHETILRSAYGLQDVELQAAGHLNYGVCLRTFGDLEAAQRHAGDAAAIAKTSGNKGDYTKAVELMQRLAKEVKQGPPQG